MKNLIVEKEIELLLFLENNLKDISKKKLKSLLKYKCIKVNNKVVTKFDHKLKVNDKVTVNLNSTKQDNLDILYEDKYLLVVYKKEGLLTVATTKEKENTLYHIVREYLNRKKEKAFIVHRLDKDTSGIVVFAKSEKVKNILQNNWDKYAVKRMYAAIIVGKLKKSGTIESYLKENDNHIVYVSKDKKNSKKCITKYKVIKSKENFSLIEIEIKTGRTHQIRVQFNEINHPILGDTKYGKVKAKRMYLDANKMEFIHPINNKKIIFEESFNNFTEVYNKL